MAAPAFTFTEYVKITTGDYFLDEEPTELNVNVPYKTEFHIHGGDILINGLIDGEGAGFESNRGPGCNSLLTDSSGNELIGYGATHAGLGYISGR